MGGEQIGFVERVFSDRKKRDAKFAESLVNLEGSASTHSELLGILGGTAETIQRGMCPQTFKKLFTALKWSFFNGTFSTLHKGADTLPNRWKIRINERIDEAADEIPLKWVTALVKTLRLKVTNEDLDLSPATEDLDPSPATAGASPRGGLPQSGQSEQTLIVSIGDRGWTWTRSCQKE